LGVVERPVINLKYYLSGTKISTIASISNRTKMRAPIIIGRRDIQGFLVVPGIEDKPHHWVPPKWNATIN